ncbi:phage holin family protein [Clostridium botulinum]|uniref:Holin n=1 Tax=Clostridium botulinum C/D str. DC5 TaxID=1443128 RepID=A0A0A0IH53_CLOBO|nr:phage holin family protein [Clostridium botulinum]KGM99591.1 holin [Clostridium botulinum C/D str. DC5]KOC52461.1 holin [Clostridium botulinum]KOC56449.1 holin [Clostridium botulinum]MCD3234340.1 phage holin family protein [Clostridium botulinum D/C]MCD3240164.1 phage holin family protein [Clostridium botulinum D/C]
MKNIIETIQMIFVTIGGWLGWILGGADGFLYALITFVIIDYLTGIMASILEQKLSSEAGFRGIFKKVLTFVLVGVAHIIDYYLIGSGSAIRTAVIFFYISNEGISILENTARIGLPIPDKLRNILEQLKEENKNG